MSKFNLHYVLNETIPFILRGSKCKSEIFATQSIPDTIGDIGQINQVISNLVINSVQSMPNARGMSVTSLFPIRRVRQIDRSCCYQGSTKGRISSS